jgi:hypothetical protein
MRLIRRLSSSRRVNHNSKRSASYEFRDLTDTGIGNLFEGKVIYDKTYGHVAYGCASCCGYYPPVVLTYDPFGIPLSDTFLNGVSAYDYCADMMSIVDGNFYYNWGTGDTSIATVDGYGTHTGVGVGSTSSGTSGTLTSQGGRRCPLTSHSPSGTANTIPKVRLNVANPYAFVGSDPTIPQVLMQAIGNPSNGSYSWTASPSNSVSFNNPNTDVVQVKGINPSSSPSDTTLTVNYSAGGTSAAPATVNITVRVFELLSPDSPTAVILPQPNGFYASVTYNVLTGPAKQTVQPGYGGITVTENVTTDSATLNGTPLTPDQLASITLYQGTGGTDANTQVGDDQRLLNNTGNPLPSGLVINLSQDLFVGGFYVRSNGIQKTSSPQAVTITNRGPVIP